MFFWFSRKHMFVIFKIPNGFSLPRIPWGIYRTISAAEIVFLLSISNSAKVWKQISKLFWSSLPTLHIFSSAECSVVLIRFSMIDNKNGMLVVVVLFRNKRLMLDEITKWNASKLAALLEYENQHNFFSPLLLNEKYFWFPKIFANSTKSFHKAY